jgi:peptidoglycan hydrolase-like protein with peptidoglycan-binding domain
MTASTLSRLPLLAGGVLAAGLGRAGHWTLERYMRAPLASTGLLLMVTMTAMAASNALYNQHQRHPAPFFSPSTTVPQAVSDQGAAQVLAPVPETASPQIQQAQTATPVTVTQETTGSVAAPAPQVIPDAPVGNKDAFAVQKKLFELGLFQGTVDGFYGPMTARAIRSFEERNGLTPTGALTPAVIDAILRADANGRVPVALAAPQPVAQPAPVQVVQPAPAPVVQQAVVAPVKPAPQPAPAPIQQQAAVQLPALTPVDQAVDTVGNAAASTIDSIVAAVGGSQRTTPPAALPMMPVTNQPMPAPVQVASLEPMAAPQPVTAVQAEPVPDQLMATAANAEPVNPANNTQLVSQIQRGLASLGFYHGSIDGHPGDATARAIREFENFHSYKVTGQVNPDLVGLLRESGASI